jgi:translation initiation factor IF-2
MGVRLNKVLSELNIGLQTAIDFLKKKSSLGEVKDDATPNTKISDAQYEALVGEFKGDKAVKTQADMIFTKKVKEKKAEKVEKAMTKTDELLEQRQQVKPLGKIDLDNIGKPKAEPQAEPKAEPKTEPQPEPEAKVETPVEAEPAGRDNEPETAAVQAPREPEAPVKPAAAVEAPAKQHDEPAPAAPVAPKAPKAPAPKPEQQPEQKAPAAAAVAQPAARPSSPHLAKTPGDFMKPAA